MKIGVKITVTFFAIAFLSMLVIGVISYNRAKSSLEKQSFEKLTAVREMKSRQIQDYFQIIQDQLSTSAENPMMIEAMKEFKNGYNTICAELKIDDEKLKALKEKSNQYFNNEVLPRLNKNMEVKTVIEEETSRNPEAIVLQNQYIIDNPNNIGVKHKFLRSNEESAYTNAHAKYHPVIKNFLEKFGYYDIFLIDNKTGNIVYTVYKEVDFASCLLDGPHRNTNLASAFNAVKDAKNKSEIRLVDYKPYHPSYNAPSSFIAAPIFDGDTEIGVLVFQMPIDKINDIMTNKQQWAKMGLGATGETYIVAEDYTIRNQSRFLIEDSTDYFKMLADLKVDPKTISKIKNFNSTIGLQEVKTQGTEEALKGVSDTRIFNDYRGVSVLSAFKPLDILNMQWVILSEIDEAEAFAEVNTLRNNIITAFAVLLLFVFATSYFVSREITRPLKELTIDAQELGNGNLDIEIPTGRKDEIGTLADSFKKMQGSIGKLIGDLRHMNHTLEEKVEERTAEVVKQKNVIEEKQKEIVDSIMYAKRIQTTILASESFLNKNLPDHFVYFKPKDIVSGDFYWATLKDNRFYLATCDSTGHGVPGAFMSLLNISFLNEAITQKNIEQPNEIFNHVRKRLIKNISKEGGKDGMDGILLCIDSKTNQYTYSAAHNKPIVISNGAINDYHADKMPIGIGVREDDFTHNALPVKKGDILYMYTDGYADQFGGPKGKKFKYKQLNELLLTNSHLPMDEQKKVISETFESWKGTLEQIDDVCIIGIRVK
ncbi:MAG: SpoIIE family protein phosphatase [Bacteroidia bacterium]|nr:SpoIIE family protein phosphatase [Bacteroidia bacterium]